MLVFCLSILVLIVAAEALTEIVVKSKIFNGVRVFFTEGTSWFSRFVGGLLTCGHCFSLWAAVMLVGATLYIDIDFFAAAKNPVIWIIFTLFIHRMSNYLHFAVDRLDKFYK